MKERILTGWTISRLLYLVMGAAIIVQGVMEQMYWGIAFGGYFVAMGLFNFGFAAGCYGGNSYSEPQQKPKPGIANVEFEEVKVK